MTVFVSLEAAMYLQSLAGPGTGNWQEDASCASIPVELADELFFQAAGRNVPAATRKLCAACPVMTDCRQDARDNGEEYGTWGGESAYGRRRYIARRKAAEEPLRAAS